MRSVEGSRTGWYIPASESPSSSSFTFVRCTLNTETFGSSITCLLPNCVVHHMMNGRWDHAISGSFGLQMTSAAPRRVAVGFLPAYLDAFIRAVATVGSALTLDMGAGAFDVFSTASVRTASFRTIEFSNDDLDTACSTADFSTVDRDAAFSIGDLNAACSTTGFSTADLSAACNTADFSTADHDANLAAIIAPKYSASAELKETDFCIFENQCNNSRD